MNGVQEPNSLALDADISGFVEDIRASYVPKSLSIAERVNGAVLDAGLM